MAKCCWLLLSLVIAFPFVLPLWTARMDSRPKDEFDQPWSPVLTQPQPPFDPASIGQVPGLPRGFPRPMPHRSGEVLSFHLQEALHLTDEQKKQLADLQKEVDNKLANLLTEEQNRQLKKMRERGPGGFGPGPGGRGPSRPAVVGGSQVERDPHISLTNSR